MTLEWNGDEAIAQMREEIARRMLAASIELINAHKINLNVSNPYGAKPHYQNPAKIGQFPHKRTGALQRGVIREPNSQAEVAKTLRLRVGLAKSVFYGAILADRGWKGLLDTLATVRPRLQAILGQSGQATGVS